MSIQVKEVHKFDKGLHGSISETDISSESASLSLNIDPNSEYGTLRGIYGDKILGTSGWEPPRRPTWSIVFFSSITDKILKLYFEKRCFMINAYDKQYLLVFCFDNEKVEFRLGGRADDNTLGNIGINADQFYDSIEYNTANNPERTFNVIPILLQSSLEDDGIYIYPGKIADVLKSTLESYATPSTTLQAVSGFDSYFHCVRPGISNEDDLLKDGSLTIYSNFYGDINTPYLPTDLFPNGGTISGTLDTNTGVLRLPDHSVYENPTKFIRGNGFSPIQTFDGIDGDEGTFFDFIKIKAFNSKGSLNILGISKTHQVQLIENIGSNVNSSPIILGQATVGGGDSVSIEQRNKNLYIGTGNSEGSSSLWVGYINRNQLGENIDGYQLEKSSLDPISPSVSSFDYDNIVIPTLHHGLNSSNGGIAGAASLYSDSAADDLDMYGDQIGINSYKRSVNGWVRQCVKNAGIADDDCDDYSDACFALGMVFRVNLGKALVCGDFATAHDGLSAYNYLRELKQLAKGDFTPLGSYSSSDETSSWQGGSGEVLHDGDLFQLVYIPDAGSLDTTEDNTPNMFRLAYVGSLFGREAADVNHPSFGNSTKAFCGIPAYGYSHINDGEILSRISLTSKPDIDLETTSPKISLIATKSDGIFVSNPTQRINSLNLQQELGISDFNISTISECKSVDGAGGFGGDITNKNYFTGHGKLWVANKNEHNVIYLIDVSNWDGYNVNKPKVSYQKIHLNFSRIHKHLLSDNDTNYGNGLIRLWEPDGSYETEKAYFTDYSWEPEPTGQYISSICETYSHLPHLGDGAGGGAVNGDGKWRVWVEYTKGTDVPHSRYDLFLFNFRPQAWIGEDTDIGNDLNASNTTVHMFDKTPPYQECQKTSISSNLGGHVASDNSTNALYYPFDKFAIKHDSGLNHANCSHSRRLMKKDFGSHYIIKNRKDDSSGNGSQKLVHNQVVNSGINNTLYDNIQFRNPSGEIHNLRPAETAWFADPMDPQYDDSGDDAGRKIVPINPIHLGTNLGWVLGSPRNYLPVRHTLKPYYKKWYFTGDSSSDVSNIPHVEEDNYKESGKKTLTAHVVSSFGKMSGHFVKYGGTLTGGAEKYNNNNYGPPQWFATSSGTLEHYDNQYVMFSLHDSPVAIETYNSTAYEVQGKPNTSPETETVVLEFEATPDLTRKYHKDTEAGFMGSRDDNQTAGTNDTINHSSISATMGYGMYNQYRYHHANNGTNSVDTNTTTTGKIESYLNGNTYGYGGQYHGQDGFGHYINITQTWACNQDYTPNNLNRNSYISILSNSVDVLDPDNTLGKNARSHGWGDGALFKGNNVRKATNTTLDGRWWSGDHYEGSTEDNETHSRHGTGYFTYGPNSFELGHNLWNEFYDVDATDIDYADNDFKLQNDTWSNRRIVHCWSTTCLTDSIHNYNFGDTRQNDNGEIKWDHREWGLWKTPRCSFRKLIVPSYFGADAKIDNVDIITWSDRNTIKPNKNTHLTNDQVKIKSGYLVSFNLPNSNINDLDNIATGMAVYETKNSTFHSFRHEEVEDRPFDDTSPIHAHSRAAIDFLRSLYFTSTVNNASEDTITSNQNIYSNTRLLTKNICPGLADDTTSNWTTGATRRGQSTSALFFPINDVYSPISISQDGSESKQSLGIWYRAQWEESDIGGNLNAMTTREYPYYIFDRLWNYWAQYGTSNFDRGNNDSQLFITEGWGSTAGISTNFETTHPDDTYPFGYEGGQLNNSLITASGAHIKKSNPPLLSLEDFIETQDNPEFPAGDILYKFSFTYDGFQESPLSFNAFPLPLPAPSKLLRLKLTVPSSSALGINSRVTHLNIYRKNNIKELYRLVKTVNLNSNKEAWQDEYNNYGTHKILNFNDEGRASSYEGINGVAESLTNFTPNYRVSCQLNDFLFVGGVYHPDIEEGEHLILRSKQGRFSVFDWSNDFLDIPTKPVAIASFANRVWVFDNNSIYKINPTGLYIEERTEGIGILNSESFIVTDMGMFWSDRNNIYKHDGQKINQIGTAILKNHANPEWQLGYLDAVNKSEKLGYTPKIGYDPINQCIYISVQGFSKTLLSYKRYDGRIYSYDIKQDRWDYYDSPAIKTMTTDNNGDVLMSDGFQIYNYRRDKKSPKDFSWDSKSFQLGSANYKKSLKALKFSGDVCLWRFNNGGDLVNDVTLDDSSTDEPDYQVLDNTHLLEISEASEDDDLKVYVDGILQTMRIKSKHPVIGNPIGNDSTGEIYKLSTYLPEFSTKGEGMTYEDSFSLDPNACPEFLTWPNSQFKRRTYEGELSDLLHLHRGMYIYFKGIDRNGVTQEEIVRIRDIKFNWFNNDTGINDLNTGVGAIEVRTFRGQLGTRAYNWGNEDLILSTSIDPMRPASPTFLFPRGKKGSIVKISLQNQKSFIDSFALSYRVKRFK